MKNLFAIILLSLCIAQSTDFPNEEIIKLGSNWFQTTSWIEIHDDITPALAKEKAINQALTNIIEFSSGVEIKSNSLSIMSETNMKMDIDHFSQIINSMSNGIILEKEILKEETKIIDGYLLSIVTIRAKTGKLEGKSDPFFKLEANLNRENYQQGDEMIININSTKDCFVYVFNILSDETVSALLPNQYISDNFLQKGKSLRVPPAEGKITKFRVDLPEDKTQATEMIMILGIKTIEDEHYKDFDLTMGNYKMAMKELMEFIMDFPRDRIEQVSLPYVITSK
ncbi:MAG: DUF4384 domain-containing protein [Candidatus Marinimicrobia bacterium]|nr:DUF4384 domain-containing protein [Candidatus Neomarinimicrobiota bacterium]MBL7023177.1 DUF4384 domain-containing protein [Candidatus Neomarinimicrobiota bacterium]MBL7109015.1 DUF4384 domain-containing protein [Candidatus Neomarinimicrobiota bacterium]